MAQRSAGGDARRSIERFLEASSSSLSFQSSDAAVRKQILRCAQNYKGVKDSAVSFELNCAVRNRKYSSRRPTIDSQRPRANDQRQSSTNN
jgi:hypothetical protein